MNWSKPKDKTVVVNMYRDRVSNGVYIGRDFKDPHGRGKWGNPFKIGKDGDREQVICKHINWLNEPEQAELKAQIVPELKGKVLLCYCKPKPCHGDILAAIANEEEG